MKIADNRQALHPDKVPAWMHHIACNCGVTFGWEPSKGSVVTCPCLKKVEDIPGADKSPISQVETKP